MDGGRRRNVRGGSETLNEDIDYVLCVAQLDDGRIVIGTTDEALVVFAMGDDGVFAAAQTLSGHTGDVNCVQQLDDGRIASGSRDKTLNVWE